MERVVSMIPWEDKLRNENFDGHVLYVVNELAVFYTQEGKVYAINSETKEGRKLLRYIDTAMNHHIFNYMGYCIDHFVIDEFDFDRYLQPFSDILAGKLKKVTPDFVIGRINNLLYEFEEQKKERKAKRKNEIQTRA